MAKPAQIPRELTSAFTMAQARAAGLTRRQLQGASWMRIGRGHYVFAGLLRGRVEELAAMLGTLPTGPGWRYSRTGPVRQVRLELAEVTVSRGLPATAGRQTRRRRSANCSLGPPDPGDASRIEVQIRQAAQKGRVVRPPRDLASFRTATALAGRLRTMAVCRMAPASASA